MPSSLVDILLRNDPGERAQIMSTLTPVQRKGILQLLKSETDNPWSRYADDAIGFIEEGIHEGLWSKQREICQSVVENQRTAVAACHAPGKALTIDTPVLTRKGWVNHGDLRRGDKVIGSNGQQTTVLAVTPHHLQPTYRVTFADGTHVDAAGPHEWLVRTRGGNRVMETQQMLDCWRPNGATRAARFSVKVAAPVTFAPHEKSGLTPLVDPYLLGYWLGDGDTARPYITVHRDDYSHLASRCGRHRIPPSRERATTVAVSLLGVRGDFEMYDLLGNKHIPREYLWGSLMDRRSLLSGLLDSDGWAQGTEACFVSTSERLARDTLALARSVGEKPTLRSRPARLNGAAHGTAWLVSWSPITYNPFTLPRKRDALEGRLTQRSGWRSIVSIEPLGDRLVSCIEVEAEDHLYLAGEGLIPTHNSHLAGRIVAWWVASHPPGTAMAVTIAPTHRQVRTILWPHIRKVAFQNNLPGDVLTQAWKMHGDVVAYGFSPSPYDESAAQGIHAPHLLIVVDEAGGIGEVVGQALEALMTGGHTRLLLLGNPPTDKEDSWFERTCSSDLYNVIHLPAAATPNFTGEEVGQCMACPAFVGAHSIATHLVDQRWVDEVTSEFGADSAFVEARVHARFPRMSKDKVIPLSWIEMAEENERAIASDVIRLGVDVAADGGDEFAIGKADGYHLSVVHRSSGQANNNAVDVAGVVLEHILEAEAEHAKRGVTERVKVKIDTIGVGWGVVGILQKWATEGKHHSVIVPVNVAKRARDEKKFTNQRAEMWWNGRLMFQPNPEDEDAQQVTWTDLPRQVLAQLAGPKYQSDSGGRISIEGKAAMKRRGVRSPDQAEALLLALYEPPGGPPEPATPIPVGQDNPFLVGGVKSARGTRRP